MFLVKLWASRAILPRSSSDSFGGVRELGRRLEVWLEVPSVALAIKAVVDSSTVRGSSDLPLTVMTPHGPGILSLR